MGKKYINIQRINSLNLFNVGGFFSCYDLKLCLTTLHLFASAFRLFWKPTFYSGHWSDLLFGENYNEKNPEWFSQCFLHRKRIKRKKPRKLQGLTKIFSKFESSCSPICAYLFLFSSAKTLTLYHYQPVLFLIQWDHQLNNQYPLLLYIRVNGNSVLLQWAIV